MAKVTVCRMVFSHLVLKLWECVMIQLCPTLATSLWNVSEFSSALWLKLRASELGCPKFPGSGSERGAAAAQIRAPHFLGLWLRLKQVRDREEEGGFLSQDVCLMGSQLEGEGLQEKILPG